MTTLRIARMSVALIAVVLPLGTFRALAAEPTWADDIAPIMFEHCASCHHPNGGGPWDFRDYEAVKRRARLIADAVDTLYMPPWKASPIKGVSFANERGLSDKQIDAIIAWAKGERALGDAAAAPPRPVYTTDWRLGEPDIVLQMAEPFNVPADGPDIYRNFVIPMPELPDGQYLRGVEYRPKAKKTAHHTLFFLDTSGNARARDASSPGPGYDGMDAVFNITRLATWAVGQVPQPWPEGVALQVPDDADLLMQAHFHPLGKEETEQAEVALYLTDTPPTRSAIVLDVPFAFGVVWNLDIPAGEPNYVVNESYTVTADVDLSSIMPHMHSIGTDMEATAVLPDGSRQPLIKLMHWDFNWQENYVYAEPVHLPAGTRIDMTFRYDNSPDNPSNPHHPPRRITWGPDSDDEMASMSFFFVTDTEEQRQQLLDGYIAQTFEDIENMDVDLVVPAIIEQARRRVDQNDDGEVDLAEYVAILQHIAFESETDEYGFQQALRKKIGGRLILHSFANSWTPYYIVGMSAVVLALPPGTVWLLLRRRKRTRIRE